MDAGARKKRMLVSVFSVEQKVIADDLDKVGEMMPLPRVESTSVVEFEGLDLPGLSSRPCTAAYRHTSHGLQKQELARTESAAMREQSLPGNRLLGTADDAVDRREAAAADHLGYRIAQITAPASDAEETKFYDTEAGAQPRKQEPEPVQQTKPAQQTNPAKPAKRKSQALRTPKVAVVPLSIASIGGPPRASGTSVGGSPHASGSPRIATTSLMPSLAMRPGAPKKAVTKPVKQKAFVAAGKAGSAGGNVESPAALGPDGQPKKKRRVVKPRDPSQPSPKPWEESEINQLKQMVADEGPGNWESKAARLGFGRTAKALHTRWLRDEGRIIDRPRTASTTGSGNPNPTTVAAAKATSTIGSKAAGATKAATTMRSKTAGGSGPVRAKLSGKATSTSPRDPGSSSVRVLPKH